MVLIGTAKHKYIIFAQLVHASTYDHWSYVHATYNHLKKYYDRKLKWVKDILATDTSYKPIAIFIQI